MMTMRYAGGSATVTDGLCGALLDYAMILGRMGEQGIAEFPALTEDGTARQVTLLLAPGSELWFCEIESADGEIDDSEAIRLLTTKGAQLNERRAYRAPATGDLDSSGAYFDTDSL